MLTRRVDAGCRQKSGRNPRNLLRGNLGDGDRVLKIKSTLACKLTGRLARDDAAGVVAACGSSPYPDLKNP